jgi:hypothetical protein
MEETSWGQRRMEVPFEGGQSPDGAVASKIGGLMSQTESPHAEIKTAKKMDQDWENEIKFKHLYSLITFRVMFIQITRKSQFLPHR